MILCYQPLSVFSNHDHVSLSNHASHSILLECLLRVLAVNDGCQMMIKKIYQSLGHISTETWMKANQKRGHNRELRRQTKADNRESLSRHWPVATNMNRNLTKVRDRIVAPYMNSWYRFHQCERHPWAWHHSQCLSNGKKSSQVKSFNHVPMNIYIVKDTTSVDTFGVWKSRHYIVYVLLFCSLL